MYLIPPMDDEVPPAYVEFVVTHLGELRRETGRLVGGDAVADHLYLDVLADVAGHWRRLCWLSRWSGRDAAADYLARRLAARTNEWRDEQLYPVDVRVLPPSTVGPPGAATASLALRKAAVLPGTARSGVVAVADAGIAWVHAYQRQQWRRVGRLVAAGILLVGGMIQFMSTLSPGS